MSVLRRLFGPLITILTSIWRFVRGLLNLVSSLLSGILGPPANALKRVLQSMYAKVASAVARLLALWANVFQPGKKQTKVSQPTPGAYGIPLAAAIVTALVWVALPLQDTLELSPVRYVGAQLATFACAAFYLRHSCRKLGPGRFEQWVIQMANPAGLKILEWIGFVAACILVRSGWQRGTAETVSYCLLAFGFLALLAQPYEPRPTKAPLPKLVSPADAVAPTGTSSRDLHFQFGTASDPAPVFGITIRTDLAEYERQKAVNPIRPLSGQQPDFTPWVLEQPPAEVRQIAHSIRKTSTELAAGAFGEIELVLGFVQSIPYTLDIDSTGEEEYWRFPIETLVDRTGDCEDFAILAAAILIELGHDVLPVVTTDHAAIAVATDQAIAGHSINLGGRSYYYCETTAQGALVGELPDGVAVEDLVACPLSIGVA